LGLLISTVAAQAQNAQADDETESSTSNAANNPAEPRPALQYWNQYATSLNGVSGGAENGVVRGLLPFEIGSVQQILHINPSIATNPTTRSGPRTGLGDTQIYDYTLGKFDFGLPQKVTLGFGPLLAIPTSSSRNFGTNAVQAGAAAIILAPQSWGLIGALGTHQQPLSGVSSKLTVAQPLIFFNLQHGYYLRSSAAVTFDTGNHTSVVPIGFGLGKVMQLDDGYTLNVYAEAQPSIYRSGVGAPNCQVFTGIALQLPRNLIGWAH
jgi:hypothetical protein